MPKKEQIVRVEGLGTYRLIEQLGDGMIAAVWRGEGEGAHASEQVAVKIAHPALSPNLQKQ
ncbi:MAG: hypothetical protein GY832_44610, partial [Chloroflexi bacterium]|nr:hypothetical protein [Chloroflexota bacterium]